MSFVDLMKDDIWSEGDITNHTENIIRAYLSRDEETILNRKVTGMLLGQYTLTSAEQAQLAAFASKTFEVRALGDAARVDVALLVQVLDYELGPGGERVTPQATARTFRAIAPARVTWARR